VDGLCAQQNRVDPSEFAKSLRDLLRNGRGKHQNIFKHFHKEKYKKDKDFHKQKNKKDKEFHKEKYQQEKIKELLFLKIFNYT